MSHTTKRSIVVGVDFDRGGDDAIVESVKLVAEGWATTLHGVHVLDPTEVFDHPTMPALFREEQFLELAPQAIREHIDEIARIRATPIPPQALQIHARLGGTVNVLLQVAADYDADMIVVGTRRRQGLERLSGSVSQLLVRNAMCTVLVARSKDHSMLAKTERPVLPYGPGEEPPLRAVPFDRPMHISTEPSNESPTGVRIV